MEIIEFLNEFGKKFAKKMENLMQQDEGYCAQMHSI